MYSNTPVEITTGYLTRSSRIKVRKKNSALRYRSSMDTSCVLIKATCFQTIQDEPHGKSRALTQTEQVLEVFECLHVCSDLQNATIRGEQITNTTKAMMRNALFICTRIGDLFVLLYYYLSILYMQLYMLRSTYFYNLMTFSLCSLWINFG